MQFCTQRLKIEPAIQWLEKNDPNKEAECLVGVRRAESKSRANFPEYIEKSENHGGRSLWAPLVRLADSERDELIYKAGWAPLETRSQECFPCVNASRKDLRLLSKDRIEEIERLEKELSTLCGGRERFMFRAKKFKNARGIRQVKKWADSDWGKYQAPDYSCDSGYCGI